MTRYLTSAVCLLLSAFALAACDTAAPQGNEPVAQAAAGAADSSKVRELTWEELMPEGEEERLAALYAEQYAQATDLYSIEEGDATDVAVQIGSFETVDALDGIRIRLPGYSVPFDYGTDIEITEFLLVPYFGACLHAPPPPPNQTVYVTTAKPIKLVDLAQAVWVEGVLRTTTESTSLADAAYTIELEMIEAY